MADFSHLQDFLQPVSKAFLNDDLEYDAFQIGGVIDAYEEDHHPDLEVSYKACKVKYHTHAIQGMSDNDFICAAKVDELLKK